MPVYTYKALQTDGSLATGQIEASGRPAALADLARQGVQPVDLVEGVVAAPRTGSTRRVSAKNLEAFTRQLASLLAASVPLAQALHLLVSESEESTGRCHWQALYDDVIDGSSLAEAMARRAEVFPRVYSSMVKAGETGGFLDIVLRQIADFQRLDRDLRSKVHGALIYPSVLAVLSVGVLIFLMMFFIPRFQGIFADFGAGLPPLTSFIVEASLLMQRYGLLMAIALVVGVVLLRRHLATNAGRLLVEKATLRLPIIGDVAARFAMTRFCRLLGTLTKAGVPLISSLRVAREALGNRLLAEAVDEAIQRVQHGDRLGASLASCRQLFPSSVIAMITVAEQSGRLGEELVRLADDAEQELDRRLQAAVALAEPALLFVMAAFVGVIVVGMVLPIFAIQDYIN